MKVTRDVIYDLLPGYFAGELSADAKALVDEFFATDPEFARMAERFRRLYHERRGGTETARVQEKEVFQRARAVNRRFSMAVGYTVGALLALFIGALTPADPTGTGWFGFMRPPARIIAIVFAGVAIVSWIGWFAIWLRPATTDYRPPTDN